MEKVIEKLKEKLSAMQKDKKILLGIAVLIVLSLFVSKVTGGGEKYRSKPDTNTTEASQTVKKEKNEQSSSAKKEINGTNEEENREDNSTEAKEKTTEEPTTEEPTTEEPTTEEPTTVSNTVTPSFKEQMDKYEQFFDDYIDFMNKYMANPSDMNLMMDYFTFISDYADYMDAMESMDEEEMSDADLAYYLEVTARIEAKLLKIAY